MMAAAMVAAMVRGFHDPSDGEAVKSRDLVLMLLDCSPQPFSRHQFTPGHITATGLVLARDGRRLLLVHHRRLDRWLLPGGHVEPDDVGPGYAAEREVVEETGVSLAANRDPALVGVDVHGIPPKGEEPYHLHHDLIFQFHAAADDLRLSPESRAVLWCSPSEFDRYTLPESVRRAYRRALRTE